MAALAAFAGRTTAKARSSVDEGAPAITGEPAKSSVATGAGTVKVNEKKGIGKKKRLRDLTREQNGWVEFFTDDGKLERNYRSAARQ